jgi:hypothetical protein
MTAMGISMVEMTVLHKPHYHFSISPSQFMTLGILRVISEIMVSYKCGWLKFIIINAIIMNSLD